MLIAGRLLKRRLVFKLQSLSGMFWLYLQGLTAPAETTAPAKPGVAGAKPAVVAKPAKKQ